MNAHQKFYQLAQQITGEGLAELRQGNAHRQHNAPNGAGACSRV